MAFDGGIYTDDVSQEASVVSGVTFAVSAHWHSFPEKPQWIGEQGLAMEYSPNPKRLDQIDQHISSYLKNGTKIRHHLFFPGYEIGDPDKEMAERAMHLHFRALDNMDGFGEPVATVHIGLNPKKQLDDERIVRNLSNLVDYAARKGITVCVENLKRGPASDPEAVLRWAEKSGSSITMDVGHAVSCELVENGGITPSDVVELFSDKLEEIHLYEYETNTHNPPKDMSILGPVVDKLLETQCRWWTIELDDFSEISFTKNLVSNYLSAKAEPLAECI